MHNLGRRCTLVLAAAVLLMGGLGQARAQGTEPASLVIIFDGSGSMWGNLEGTKGQKLATARASE